MSAEVAAPARAAPPRRVRLAAGLWLVVSVVAWASVFDWQVRQAAVDYLTAQALAQRGAGPSVTVFSVMRPAVARAAALTSVWIGGGTAAGLALVWWASRRQAAGSARRAG